MCWFCEMDIFYERRWHPNSDLLYLVLTQWSIWHWSLMLLFSSISGLPDGKLKDYIHLTFGEKFLGDLVIEVARMTIKPLSLVEWLWNIIFWFKASVRKVNFCKGKKKFRAMRNRNSALGPAPAPFNLLCHFSLCVSYLSS